MGQRRVKKGSTGAIRTSCGRAHRQRVKIHPVLAEARPGRRDLGTKRREGAREHRSAQILRAAFLALVGGRTATAISGWACLVCALRWDPSNSDNRDLQERSLTGKSKWEGAVWVQYEVVCLLVLDLCCLSLESMMSRGCWCTSSWFLVSAHHCLDTEVNLKSSSLKFLDLDIIMSKKGNGKCIPVWDTCTEGSVWPELSEWLVFSFAVRDRWL